MSADRSVCRHGCKQACLLQAGCKGFREERIGRKWTLRKNKLGVLGSEPCDKEELNIDKNNSPHRPSFPTRAGEKDDCIAI
ncbi:MAG: hypothetical protein ACFCUU_05485 [Cyclobacteriaceae bacterium]